MNTPPLSEEDEGTPIPFTITSSNNPQRLFGGSQEKFEAWIGAGRPYFQGWPIEVTEYLRIWKQKQQLKRRQSLVQQRELRQQQRQVEVLAKEAASAASSAVLVAVTDHSSGSPEGQGSQERARVLYYTPSAVEVSSDDGLATRSDET